MHHPKVDDEGVIFLTVPEDAKAGERVAIWSSPKALVRLRVEIDEALLALSTPTGTLAALRVKDAVAAYHAALNRLEAEVVRK
jgi:hypothetical protein